MQPQREQGIFGVFKGMGDLLWASPVIRAELDRGIEVHLLLFPSEPLHTFCSLLDFGPQTSQLHLHEIPASLAVLPRFLAAMRTLSPSSIWISPHAPAADSSWRAPLLLWLTKHLFWHHAVLIGAASERLSTLFNQRLSIDRTLPLPQREWAAYRALHHNLPLPAQPPSPRFIAAITDARQQPPAYDLVIHPGASAANRIWPLDKYAALLAALPAHWKIALIAPPSDVSAVRSLLPSERLELLSGTLQDTLKIFAAARLLLVMNSGTMHFADVLGVPAVAVFGQQDPSHVITAGSITPVYRVSVPCQPCGHATCGQPQPYCLTNLEPHEVAARLLHVASAPQLIDIQAASI